MGPPLLPTFKSSPSGLDRIRRTRKAPTWRRGHARVSAAKAASATPDPPKVGYFTLDRPSSLQLVTPIEACLSYPTPTTAAAAAALAERRQVELHHPAARPAGLGLRQLGSAGDPPRCGWHSTCQLWPTESPSWDRLEKGLPPPQASATPPALVVVVPWFPHVTSSCSLISRSRSASVPLQRVTDVPLVRNPSSVPFLPDRRD